MKRLILCAVILATMGASAGAQTREKGTVKKNQQGGKKNTKASRKKGATIRRGADTATYSLQSSGTNAAYGQIPAPQIFDPTVRAMNARAAGNPVRIGSTGIVGAPRGTYGFANGRISLYMQGATTSGTSTGSGSVGTGTSLGPAGTSGPGMGVNGKSPYAAVGPYGNRITEKRQFVVVPDSASRVRSGKE